MSANNFYKKEDLSEERLKMAKLFCQEHDLDFDKVKEFSFMWVGQMWYWKVDGYSY